MYILGEDEGLILKASEAFVDTFQGKEARQPGDRCVPYYSSAEYQELFADYYTIYRWMIRGPTEYVPPVEVEVVAKRYGSFRIPIEVKLTMFQMQQGNPS